MKFFILLFLSVCVLTTESVANEPQEQNISDDCAAVAKRAESDSAEIDPTQAFKCIAALQKRILELEGRIHGSVLAAGIVESDGTIVKGKSFGVEKRPKNLNYRADRYTIRLENKLTAKPTVIVSPYLTSGDARPLVVQADESQFQVEGRHYGSNGLARVNFTFVVISAPPKSNQ